MDRIPAALTTAAASYLAGPIGNVAVSSIVSNRFKNQYKSNNDMTDKLSSFMNSVIDSNFDDERADSIRKEMQYSIDTLKSPEKFKQAMNDAYDMRNKILDDYDPEHKLRP